MTVQIHAPPVLPDSDRLDYARQIVRAEAAALEQVVREEVRAVREVQAVALEQQLLPIHPHR